MIYALIVAVLSLAGAAIPLRFRPAHAQLQLYLSLAAGALLGAALFHMLPESSEFIHSGFGMPAVLGIMVVFFLQRYLAPHSHELSPAPHSAHAHEHHDHQHTACGHTHDQGGHGHHHHCDDPPAHGEHLQSAGPFLTGLVAIVALSIHALFDGITERAA